MVRSRPPRRIGIFGGTFDPPHIGHLVAATDAREALDLDVVLLVVAHRPWQKQGTRDITSSDDRLAMVEAAVADTPGLEASDLEIRRGGTTYSVDTLEELRRGEPDAELFLLVGADAAAGFGTWERPDDVARLARLVVVDRPGAHGEPDPRWPWMRVDVPDLEISSTDLRRRFAEGRSVQHLVPAPVAAYAEGRGLYR